MKFKKKILLLWFIFALLDPDPDPLTRWIPDPDLNTDPQPCFQARHLVGCPHKILWKGRDTVHTIHILTWGLASNDP